MPEEIDYRHEFAFLLGFLEAVSGDLESLNPEIRAWAAEKIVAKVAELSKRFPVGRPKA